MVDFIRSGYTVPARVFRDNDSITVPIQWSFVPANTPGMPFAHAFGSREWEIDEGPEPAIGEADGPRVWRGGLPPFPLPVVGPLGIDDLGICGTEDQWKRGALTSDPVGPVWPFTSVSQRCKRPPLAPNGGVAIGRVTDVHCNNCFDLPRVLFVNVVNLPTFCTLANGTWPIVWDPSVQRYVGNHVLPNGVAFTFQMSCGNPRLFFVDSNGGAGGGIPVEEVCYPYFTSFIAGASGPVFGCTVEWGANVTITE
jgi:hypothetical protein